MRSDNRKTAMSFFVTNKGGEFERCPAGVHLARCYRIVDLGTQKSEYMGQAKFLHKVMIGWEIHGTDDSDKPIRMADGRPFAVFKNFTLSWSENSNLRKSLQQWRGKPFSPEEMRKFDLESILGVWAMLSIVESQGNDGKTYTNVDSITPVPAVIRKQGLPPGVNKVEMFSLEEPDMTLFETFSDNLKARIQSSPEWMKLDVKQFPSRTSVPEPLEEEEDIPF